MSSLLEINNLSVQFKTEDKDVPAVRNIHLQIPKGKTLGLVGESGSGKSVTSLCIMGLLSEPGRVSSGEILFNDQDLLKLPENEMRKIRGNRISMIFQEPMTSLNPVFTVGYQIVEALQLHQGLQKRGAWERAAELLDEVGIPNAHQRVRSFPHEMSGGQRQRVMIAMAIACQPDLLIADEPTTALDVTIQKQILELLKKLQKQYEMSMLFITHDLGVIGEVADHIAVMYEGQIVETKPVETLFKNPEHAYTKGLIACRPDWKQELRRLPTVTDFMNKEGDAKAFDIQSLGKKEAPTPESKTNPLVEIKGLKKYYPGQTNWWGRTQTWIKAVDDVSLDVVKGRTLGLVGESGCGKTTLGRTLLRLVEPTEGSVHYQGENLMSLSASAMRAMRKKLQIVFQDPYASLNPRMTIGKAIMEPMQIHNLGSGTEERREKAEQLLKKVGLDPLFMERFPHEFSGGQRQRVCIARALAVEPEFIVCDESVSSLDVSIQAQILNLLMDLKEEFELTYIFISHDLSVVHFISDDVAVMKDGKIVEKASADTIYRNPQDPYTQKLLDSIPKGIS